MPESRITVVPGVCGGRPTVRGLRMTVADVLELLAGGMSHDEILVDYPYLEREDIGARLEAGPVERVTDAGSDVHSGRTRQGRIARRARAAYSPWGESAR